MQWEFQVGPSVGIEAGDHIWCARYLLEVTNTCLEFEFIMLQHRTRVKNSVTFCVFRASVTENH